MKRSIDITKIVASTLAIVSGVVTMLTLILINIFDVYTFMEIMKIGTLVFIISGCYLIGYDDGSVRARQRMGVKVKETVELLNLSKSLEPEETVIDVSEDEDDEW